MVEFTSLLYTLQENKTIYGQVIESSELVKYGIYFSPVKSHLIW